MDSGNLALAKKMAQSIIKDGTVRDMDLFNDISGVLKTASDDPEAKSLLNRITLIKLSSLSQKTVSPPPQNTAPVEEKISPPVQERVYPPAQPPVQPKVVVPPPQEKVYPTVQPKIKPPIQAKPAPVQNKVATPVQPKTAPVQPKAAAPKPEISAGKAPEEQKSDSIPVGLWLLAIILVLPGGIIASIMAKKKNPAKSGALLIVGILTSIIAAIAIYITMKYTL
jgi:hypothetical protein